MFIYTVYIFFIFLFQSNWEPWPEAVNRQSIDKAAHSLLRLFSSSLLYCFTFIFFFVLFILPFFYKVATDTYIRSLYLSF